MPVQNLLSTASRLFVFLPFFHLSSLRHLFIFLMFFILLTSVTHILGILIHNTVFLADVVQYTRISYICIDHRVLSQNRLEDPGLFPFHLLVLDQLVLFHLALAYFFHLFANYVSIVILFFSLSYGLLASDHQCAASWTFYRRAGNTPRVRFPVTTLRTKTFSAGS